jgi:hypothetical protein
MRGKKRMVGYGGWLRFERIKEGYNSMFANGTGLEYSRTCWV